MFFHCLILDANERQRIPLKKASQSLPKHPRLIYWLLNCSAVVRYQVVVYQTSSVDAEVVVDMVAVDTASRSILDFAEGVDQPSSILGPATQFARIRCCKSQNISTQMSWWDPSRILGNLMDLEPTKRRSGRERSCCCKWSTGDGGSHPLAAGILWRDNPAGCTADTRTIHQCTAGNLIGFPIPP